MLYPPLKKLRSSVRPSAHGFHSLLVALFNQFFSNLLCELILGRSVLGLQIGKFWQICTELRPLIDVRNWFSLSIFGIPLPILFKLALRVYCEGVFWDSRLVNFNKYVQSYSP